MNGGYLPSTLVIVLDNTRIVCGMEVGEGATLRWFDLYRTRRSIARNLSVDKTV